MMLLASIEKSKKLDEALLELEADLRKEEAAYEEPQANTAENEIIESKPVGSESKAPPPKKERIVTYTGSITTRSTKPDSLFEIALRITKDVKGYIEFRDETMVTLRVPAGRFSMVFDLLLKLGEIVDFEKSAEDITDAYFDTDSRITILEKTIKRYMKLLTLTESDTLKISLLKEIENLREELETLKIQKKTLTNRAQYATIHFAVEERATGYSSYTTASGEGFGWIGSLDPFGYQEYREKKFGKKLKFRVPSGMVRLKEEAKVWIAGSPGGTRMWSYRVRNSPTGTSRFWVDAVRFRLKEQFAAIDTGTVAGYHFLRCKPHPGMNYIYSVGLNVVGKKIEVIQLYFPSEEQEKRYLEAVREVIKKERAS
jgi:hypothetical protein